MQFLRQELVMHAEEDKLAECSKRAIITVYVEEAVQGKNNLKYN